MTYQNKLDVTFTCPQGQFNHTKLMVTAGLRLGIEMDLDKDFEAQFTGEYLDTNTVAGSINYLGTLTINGVSRENVKVCKSGTGYLRTFWPLVLEDSDADALAYLSSTDRIVKYFKENRGSDHFTLEFIAVYLHEVFKMHPDLTPEDMMAKACVISIKEVDILTEIATQTSREMRQTFGNGAETKHSGTFEYLGHDTVTKAGRKTIRVGLKKANGEIITVSNNWHRTMEAKLNQLKSMASFGVTKVKYSTWASYNPDEWFMNIQPVYVSAL